MVISRGLSVLKVIYCSPKIQICRIFKQQYRQSKGKNTELDQDCSFYQWRTFLNPYSRIKQYHNKSQKIYFSIGLIKTTFHFRCWNNFISHILVFPNCSEGKLSLGKEEIRAIQINCTDSCIIASFLSLSEIQNSEVNQLPRYKQIICQNKTKF